MKVLSCLVAASMLMPASAMAQNDILADRLSEILGVDAGRVIIVVDGNGSGGAEALMAGRAAARPTAAGGNLVTGGVGGLGYTCTGEGDTGSCSCGPGDPCSGMLDACTKLGGTTTVCDNATRVCTCDY